MEPRKYLLAQNRDITSSCESRADLGDEPEWRDEKSVERSLVILEPGFSEYVKHKRERLRHIRRPLFHGTGSSSLVAIITEGIVPRPGSQIMSGERSAVSRGTSARPTSFAELDSSGNGEATAHFFAQLTSQGKDLILSEAKIKHQDTLQNYLYRIGPGALEDAIQKKFERALATSLPDNNPEVTLGWIRRDVEQKIKLLSQGEAYRFDILKVGSHITELKKIIDGQYNDPELLGDALLEMGIIDNLRYLYTKRGALPAPWSKLSDFLQIALKDVRDPESVVHRSLLDGLQAMQQKMDYYTTLDEDEQQKIIDQYPCVLLVEGDGLALQRVDWMATCQELHTMQSVDPSRIRQIRVPYIHIEEVKLLLTRAGLNDVDIIPFEYYDLEKLIENSH